MPGRAEAVTEYDLWVCGQRVTSANKDSIAGGVTYDPDTATLTLKDFNLVNEGVDIGQGLLSAVVIAKENITIELIGDNYITSRFVAKTLLRDFVFGYKDVTVVGSGNLTLTAPGPYGSTSIYDTSGLYSNAGDIYLNGSGKLTFINNGEAFSVAEGHKVYYGNGDILYQNEGGTNAGDLMRSSKIDRFSFENMLSGSPHSLTIKNSSGEIINKNDLATYIKTSGHDKNITFTMTHSFNQRVSAPEYLASGDCVNGARYYYSCACGACGTEERPA